MSRKRQREPSSTSSANPATNRDQRPSQVRSSNSSTPKISAASKPPPASVASVRASLPITHHAAEITSYLLPRTPSVLLLSGETGSGKSTQVPQFLLPEKWCTKCIAITQPRRVAAISLARRVAQEMGFPHLSARGCPVGYAVRFDSMVTDQTRIKFLTEGMLLQEMLADPSLSKYSAVVVDEVHERSVNVDLILGFLRKIAFGGGARKEKERLRVVIMSATADVEGLSKFFNAGVAQVGGGQQIASNGTVIQAGEKESANTNSGEAGEKENNTDAPSAVQLCYIKGRQYPVKIIYLNAPTFDWLEEARRKILDLHTKEPLYQGQPGDILVFLPGQEDVESLERQVNETLEGVEIPGIPKILTLPLFAALPQAAQQRVFEPAPHRTRKLILATNIAETSITVPGVRFVIDCGKAKIKQFRNRLGLDSLLVKPISQSSAQQRAGRAGREAAGHCYRLYTEKQFHELDKDSTPEILRCDLAAAVLTMKARNIENVLSFPFLSPPPRDSMEKALLSLFGLSALNDSGDISSMGRIMAEMPLTPALGRILLEAARPERDCLSDVIDIIAALSVEKIFIQSMDESLLNEGDAEDEDSPARRKLEARLSLQHPESDHLTYLNTVRAYEQERSDRKAWAERHLVSHRAMQNIMDIRKQLRSICIKKKLLKADEEPRSERNNDAILQSLLRGFAANTAVLERDGSYKTIQGHQTVTIHPSSVLHGRKRHIGVMFSEFVFTKRSYARGVSAVRVEWLGEVLA